MTKALCVSLSLLLSGCVNRSNQDQIAATKIQQAADLASQTQLQLSDVCPDGQIGKYHVTCQASGYDTDIRVTADKRTWSKKVEISGANANALSDQYVLVSGGVSDALSYIESQVFNLSSGQLVMENDGGLIYRDENFAVFSATESKIGIAQYNPITQELHLA